MSRFQFWLTIIAIASGLILVGLLCFWWVVEVKNNTLRTAIDMGESAVVVSESGAVSQAVQDRRDLSHNQCQGEGVPYKLSILPMRAQDFALLIPYGLMIGGHVTPIDHQYFSPTVFDSSRDTYDVVAMADSTIVDVQPRTTERGTEFRFVFSVSCTYFYYYDLVTGLSPKVQVAYDDYVSGKASVNLKVRAGELIGKIGGQTLDFAVWDTTKNLTGLAVPEHYLGEPWKIHTVDPLDYVTDDVAQVMRTKNIREVAPVSGKIDYDVSGRLIGNWFKLGSGGYVVPGEGGVRYQLLGNTSVIFSKRL